MSNRKSLSGGSFGNAHPHVIISVVTTILGQPLTAVREVVSALTIVVSLALGGLTMVLLHRRWIAPPGRGRRTGRMVAIVLAGLVIALAWPVALLALPVLFLHAARGDDTTPRRTPPPARSTRRAERPAPRGRPRPHRREQYRYDNYGYDSSGKNHHYYYR